MSVSATRTMSASIPNRAGIGLRAPHHEDVVTTLPAVGWLEVHSENYFGAGGAPLHYLEQARAHYPISLHGVGLSLGSTDPLDREHLSKLKKLIERIEPGLVSEHLCWSSVDGRYLNDLLPLPYTQEALDHIAPRIGEVQEFLGRRILIENLSSYVTYAHSAMPEWEFLAAVAQHADCDLLLDINNIYVSARNHRFDARTYLNAVPKERVREIHLAGHLTRHLEDGDVLIDTHNTRVCDEVWELYRETIGHLGPRPTLIEWDSDLPPLAMLVEEAATADRILERTHDTVTA